jgi:hypothetical protein
MATYPDDIPPADGWVQTHPTDRQLVPGSPMAAVSRTDIDHYPAWIEAHPDLFAQSVLRFLAQHPSEQWDCRISTFAGYIVRLTAIHKGAKHHDIA